MRYNGKNLRALLSDHQKWILTHGKEGSCAEFAFCELERVDLSNTYLSMANFFGARLIDVNFTNADLSKANFSQTNIQRAVFDDACLYRTIFTDASIGIKSALFANTTEAVFTDSHMEIESNVQLEIPINCPSSGSFIGWKKAHVIHRGDPAMKNCITEGIVKLLIPEDAKRTSSVSRKCRCSKAIALDVQERDGSPIKDCKWICSWYDPDYEYKVGDTLFPKEPFNSNRWEECSSGIHFFIDRMDAVHYIL